jgi:hypothetical protein
MTVIDLLIIAVTSYTIWRCRLVGLSRQPSAPRNGLWLVALGLIVCLFYLVDLVSMFRLPTITSKQEATAAMDYLHRNSAG